MNIRLIRTAIIAVGVAGVITMGYPDVQSGNTVGFAFTRKESPRRGRVVNRFKRIGSDEHATLKEVVGANVEGIVIQFYDGQNWQKAVSALDANDELFWCDASTGETADDYTVPHGAAIDYVLPEGEPEASLSLTGEVDWSAAETSVGAMFSEEASINDIKISSEAIRRIVGYPPPRKAEVVAVTNMPPTRFRIRMRDGRGIPAKFDYQSFKIVNPTTGGMLAVTPESVLTFEVDDDKSIPADDRMDEDRVTGLRNIYAQQFKDDKAKREKAKMDAVVSNVTEKVEANVKEEVRAQVSGIKATVDELKARLSSLDARIQKLSDWWVFKLLLWPLGLIGAYFITKELSRRHKNWKARKRYARKKQNAKSFEKSY